MNFLKHYERASQGTIWLVLPLPKLVTLSQDQTAGSKYEVFLLKKGGKSGIPLKQQSRQLYVRAIRWIFNSSHECKTMYHFGLDRNSLNFVFKANIASEKPARWRGEKTHIHTQQAFFYPFTIYTGEKWSPHTTNILPYTLHWQLSLGGFSPQGIGHIRKKTSKYATGPNPSFHFPN